MNYKIVADREHFLVYIDGKFYCSADSESEAEKEVEDFHKQH